MSEHPIDDRPNFLLIMTDQQRGDCLSIDGHPVLQTPTLDHFAASGARFTRGYSTCPSCVPARRTILTGQAPATHGMVGYKDRVNWHPANTLPQALRDAGYQTIFVGRTMHQWPRWKRFGFEEVYPSVNMPSPTDPPSDYETLLDREHHQSGGFTGHGVGWNGWVARPWHMDESLHEVHWTIGEAIKRMQRRDTSRPYFMVVSFFGPHPPLTPPAHYMQRYLDMDLPQPAMGDWADPPEEGTLGLPVATDRLNLTGQRLRQCQAGYFGYINYIDDQIARLFDNHAGGPGHARHNTYTFFTSDHGELLGDHGLFRKTYPYEGSARVPFIVRGPEVKRGTVCDQPVGHEDIMPTMLDLAGVEIDEEAHPLDGRSLAPVLRGQANAKVRDVLHGEHARCYRPEQANHYLVDNRWKYIWFSQTGIEQLFDLHEDPNELHDLSTQEAQCTEQFRQILVDRLKDRPEGFSDGNQLIAGQPHESLMAHGGEPAIVN